MSLLRQAGEIEYVGVSMVLGECSLVDRRIALKPPLRDETMRFLACLVRV